MMDSREDAVKVFPCPIVSFCIGEIMPPKNKRRTSQRSGSTKPTSRIDGGQINENTRQRSPPGKKRPRIDDENTSNRVTKRTAQASSARPPLPNNGLSKGSSSARVREGITKRVITPPRSRRPHARNSSHSPHSPSNVGRKSPSPVGVRSGTSAREVLPESSDDCDVYEVSRVPFYQHPFYKRYMGTDSDDVVAAELRGNALSPITPSSSARDRRTRNDVQNGVGEHCILQQDAHFDENAEVDGASPHRRFGSPGDRDIRRQSVSLEILLSFYKDIEAVVRRETTGLHEFLSSRFETLENEQSKLVAEIKEFWFVGSGGKSGPTSHQKATPLSKYETKLNEKTPHAEWVFDVDSICKTLQMNLPYAVISISNERGSLVDNVSVVVRAILFGLLPSQKRAAYCTGVGRRHSPFRYAVVMNILGNVQRNRFGRFSERCGRAEAVASGGEPRARDWEPHVPETRSNSNVLQIRQPKWLESGFITQKHVDEARMRVECNAGSSDATAQQESGAVKQKKAWISVKETPDKDDIARYGALKVYRFVSTALYYAREKAKWVLFEELMYITTIWSKADSDFDQRSLHVAWGHKGDDVREIEICDVPNCRKRNSDQSQADEHNMGLLAEFLSARREMVLCVSHTVIIKGSGSSVRNKRVAQERTLRTSINLIDVAAKFCVMFCERATGGFSTLLFLGTHTGSLKCIYALAVLFRRVVENFMHEYIVEGLFVTPDAEDPPEVQCHRLKLETLLPAASVRKRLLGGRCLRMTQEDFNKVNAATSIDGSGDVSNEESGGDDDDIDPLNMEGVMLL